MCLTRRQAPNSKNFPAGRIPERARPRDTVRLHCEMAQCHAEGAVGGAGALPRPLSAAGRTDAGPTGATYCFERGARKDTGGDGWADVWKRHCFAWEHKGQRAAARECLAWHRARVQDQKSRALEASTRLIMTDRISSLDKTLDRLLDALGEEWARGVSWLTEFEKLFGKAEHIELLNDVGGEFFREEESSS